MFPPVHPRLIGLNDERNEPLAEHVPLQHGAVRIRRQLMANGRRRTGRRVAECHLEPDEKEERKREPTLAFVHFCSSTTNRLKLSTPGGSQ